MFGWAENPLGRSQFFSSHGFTPPRLNPGGWSSHGQPVDQIHGAYRQHMRAADLRSLFEGDLRERPRHWAALFYIEHGIFSVLFQILDVFNLL